MSGQPVRILTRRHRVFPAKIRAENDGSVLEIDAVERCWTEVGQGGAAKFVYRVRSGSRRFFLREDGRRNGVAVMRLMQ